MEPIIQLNSEAKLSDHFAVRPKDNRRKVAFIQA